MFVTLIAGKRRSLLITGDDDEVLMTRSINVTRKQLSSIQLYAVVNLKPTSQVTRNKRLPSRYNVRLLLK